MISLSKSHLNVLFKLIHYQLSKLNHPIRLIIEKFSKMYVRMYKDYVNKSAADTEELYQKLELANK